VIHLILGVAGGIVLAVYAIATIERWRNRRAVRKMERMLYPQRYEPAPSDPIDRGAIVAWTIISALGVFVIFLAVGRL